MKLATKRDLLKSCLHDAHEACESVRRCVSLHKVEESDTEGSAQKLKAVRRRFDARWLTALNAYQSSASSAGTSVKAMEAALLKLQNEWHSIIRSSWEDAWKIGYRSRGRTTPTTSRQVYAVSPQLKSEVERQLAHASRFAQEIASGDIRQRVVYSDGRSRPRMSLGNRSQLYSKAINGAFQWGAVNGGPPGEKIYWRLGACDHCTDCPALSMSGPYTRDTLPTVPGQGLTRCSHNCCCILIFRPGPLPDRQPPEDIVADILGPQEPLPGFRAPTEAEKLVILDLESRLNYARRKMAELRGTDEAKEWISARSRINGELIDFLEGRGVYWTPRFSVPEVIDGLDIRMPDVDNLMLRGLDGFTVNSADIPKLVDELAEAMREVERIISGVGIGGAVPLVPPMSEILRALGLSPDDDP